jgi:C1A family cysteine protease
MNRQYNLKIKRMPNEKLMFNPLLSKENIPDSVDLREVSSMPPVYDQGKIGSCTANALCSAFAFEHPGFLGSRLFLYYNERVLDNNISSDSGATLADGIKTLTTHGLCPESDWPYDETKFATKPPDSAYVEALNHKTVKVYNVPYNLSDMQATLASGIPFVVGIKIFSSFESPSVAKTGIVSMPKRKKKDKFLGGHAVLVCGYNNATQMWTLKNSWGPSWGDKGYFYLPYKYLLKPKLSADFWAIEAVTCDNEPHEDEEHP